MKNLARRSGALFLGLLATLAITAYFSLYTLQENELAIITKFGNPVRIVATSGLHLKLPGMLETVNRLDTRADLIETPPTQLLLGDKKPIIISCYILWKIHDPLLFF